MSAHDPVRLRPRKDRRAHQASFNATSNIASGPDRGALGDSQGRLPNGPRGEETREAVPFVANRSFELACS
jgi:hypothetical protein